MVEAAHRGQRHRLDEATRSGGHFEHPAMIPLQPVAIGLAGAGRRLLAGQPAAPRGHPARTVADRAAEAAELALHLQARGVEHDGGGAAGDEGAIALAEALGDRPARIVAGLKFMVAHQRDFPVTEVEAAHPVRPVGHGAAIVHRIAEAGDDAVGEALRQIEEAGWIGLQRTIACKTAGRFGRGRGRGGGALPAGHAATGGQCGEGGSGGAEEAAAIGRGEGCGHGGGVTAPRGVRQANHLHLES